MKEVIEEQEEEAKSGPDDRNLLQRSKNEFKNEISRGPAVSDSPKFMGKKKIDLNPA